MKSLSIVSQWVRVTLEVDSMIGKRALTPGQDSGPRMVFEGPPSPDASSHVNHQLHEHVWGSLIWKPQCQREPSFRSESPGISAGGRGARWNVNAYDANHKDLYPSAAILTESAGCQASHRKGSHADLCMWLNSLHVCIHNVENFWKSPEPANDTAIHKDGGTVKIHETPFSEMYLLQETKYIGIFVMYLLIQT